MRRAFRLLSAALLACVLLAGCSREPAPAASGASADPATALMNQVKLLRAGDFGGLAGAALPPTEYAELRTSFADMQADRDGLPGADAQREFAEQMQLLTAPDAADRLFAQVRPLLDEYNTKYRAMMPMWVGFAQTMATTAINRNEGLAPEQKKQALDILGSAARWAQETDWGDEAKARAAITAFTDAVRDVDVRSLEDLQALGFDEAMARYGKVWLATTKALALYGLDIDAALGSIRARTLEENGDSARVQVDYTVFGKDGSAVVDMTRRDGVWYSSEVIARNAERHDGDAGEDEPAASADGAD